MSHSRDGPGVTGPLRTNIVPLTAVWNLPPSVTPPPWKIPETFSLLISEDFGAFLSLLSDRSVFKPSGKCAENTANARKREQNPEILTN